MFDVSVWAFRKDLLICCAAFWAEKRPEAEKQGKDYAQLLLGNDPERTHAVLEIKAICSECDGRGDLPIKGRTRRKLCKACKGDGVTDTVLRQEIKRDEHGGCDANPG